MLSDEEKKAIDNMKSLLLYSKEHEYFSPFQEQEIDDMNIVVNLIEKQSKEIEEAEQKEKKAYIDGTNVAHELCNKMWKNKIKAKIEEIENTGIDVAWEQVNYTIREQDRAKIEALQSLLEKE